MQAVNSVFKWSFYLSGMTGLTILLYRCKLARDRIARHASEHHCLASSNTETDSAYKVFS